MEKYKIYKRGGKKVDIELEDGVYDVIAVITIQNGAIKYIDNGRWLKRNKT